MASAVTDYLLRNLTARNLRICGCDPPTLVPGTGRYIREQSHKLSEQAHSGGKGTGRGQQKVPGKHEKTSVDDWRPPGVSTLKFIAVRSLIVLDCNFF